MCKKISKDKKGLIEQVADCFPKTTTETDGVLSTLMGWFNNVVLYPVKKANITYLYKLELFKSDLQEKINKIPVENLCEPTLNIAGPTLEALKYNFDEKDLREMYLNLLTSSMNINIKNNVHPFLLILLNS